MKGIVERILEGKFEYETGKLEFSKSKVEISLYPGESYEGSFVVKGPEGNIEYLLYMTKDEEGMTDNVRESFIAEIPKVVKEAHGELDIK